MTSNSPAPSGGDASAMMSCMIEQSHQGDAREALRTWFEGEKIRVADDPELGYRVE